MSLFLSLINTEQMKIYPTVIRSRATIGDTSSAHPFHRWVQNRGDLVMPYCLTVLTA